eukprot:scaffold2042_cov175-Ochromonas_danica.AAC.4
MELSLLVPWKTEAEGCKFHGIPANAGLLYVPTPQLQLTHTGTHTAVYIHIVYMVSACVCLAHIHDEGSKDKTRKPHGKRLVKRVLSSRKSRNTKGGNAVIVKLLYNTVGPLKTILHFFWTSRCKELDVRKMTWMQLQLIDLL